METKVEGFLKLNKIEYILHEHPAVYTCEEAEKYCGDIPGVAGKNLFLRDKKRNRYFLVILPATKRIDLKKFAELVGESKVSFADKEDLKEKMGLEPGAVSLFGILNDEDNSVELYIDRDIYDAEIVSFHPNVNISTLELSRNMFHKFLQSINHEAKIIDIEKSIKK